MKSDNITSLSLQGTTGTVALNRDGTHEGSVINLTDTNGKSMGQMSLLMPVTPDPKEAGRYSGGIEPGEYSISVSLTRKAEDAKAARTTTSGGTAATPTGASADASVGTTADRRRTGNGG